MQWLVSLWSWSVRRTLAVDVHSSSVKVLLRFSSSCWLEKLKLMSLMISSYRYIMCSPNSHSKVTIITMLFVFVSLLPCLNFDCQNGRNQLLVEYYCSVGYFWPPWYPAENSVRESGMTSLSCCVVDRKFGVKARLSQALQVTLSYVRNHTHTAAIRNLQPVLNVLKAYANNGTQLLLRFNHNYDNAVMINFAIVLSENWFICRRVVLGS